MQRTLQTHQINPTAFCGCCYLGLSGVGVSPKWLRGPAMPRTCCPYRSVWNWYVLLLNGL